MKIKTSYVPDDCDYLTVGKEYETVGEILTDGPGLFQIIDDTGFEASMNLTGCPHIGGRDWEIVK